MPKGEFKAKKSTIQPVIRDIAWAAGIYEGEGSCSIHQAGSKLKADGRKYHALHARVSQKEGWLVERFQTLFGGTTNHRIQAGQPIYTWTASGPRAVGFLLTIFSFMSPRRKGQIKEAIMQWKTSS